jgi:glycosyltransferase involved in cell wall biosynthesis
MQLIPKISVIIPSNHDMNKLLTLVKAVCSQSVKPYEIVIVDSSIQCGVCPKEVEVICADCSVNLVYEYVKCAYPGKARNIALGLSNGEMIAFIDVQTIPRPNWLELSLLKLFEKSGTYGVLGATYFSAQTRFERLVRDGFYGAMPRKTLPGSVFRRQVFEIAGQFIDWARAGEDTEWMLRLEVLKVATDYSSATLIDYVGLAGINIKLLLKKWFRNYSASRVLPHFFPQKIFLWLVLYPLIVLIAFNWNYLIADWRMDSPFYIGHVTKTAVILPILIYVIVRGLVLPMRRGVGIWRLLPLRFLAITCVCFMADFVKILVFSLPGRNYNK